MSLLIKSLSAPLLSLILMMLGSGLFNTFTSIRLEMAGYPTEAIGAVVSSLYVGILIGSIQLNRWISKAGHIQALMVFAGISACLIMIQAIWINAYFWSLVRFFSGICMAGIFIVIESWLLIQSPPSMRGRILSIYLAVFYGALSVGQFLINLAPLATIYPFCITAMFFASSLLPILAQKNKNPQTEEFERLSLLALFNISPLGILGGVISGMLLAAVYGLVPVYAKEIGMEISQIGILMAVIIFGGLVFQWPLGLWADRGNRRQILNFSAFMASLAAIIIACIPHQFSFIFLMLSWCFGGFSFTIYPLSMAFACEKIKQGQIVSATGGFVLVYGFGAIIGPLLAPLAMLAFGISGLFYFLGAITFILGITGLGKSSY